MHPPQPIPAPRPAQASPSQSLPLSQSPSLKVSQSPSLPVSQSPSLSPRPRGRPNAQRSHRISTRITQAAADHLAQIRAQHPRSLAATLETLILQFPVETNNKPNTMHPTPS